MAMQEANDTPPPAGDAGADFDAAKEAVDAAVDQASAGMDAPLTPAGPPSGGVVQAARLPGPPSERPTGVTLLAAVYALVGIFKLGFGLLALGIGTLTGLVSALLGDGQWGGAGWGFGQLVTGIVWLAVAVGLTQLRPWGWLLALIGAGLSLVGAVLNILGGGWWCLTLFDVLIPLAVVLYLFRPHVRAAFGR